MSGAGHPALLIEADLTLSVDGVEARITGDGGRVVVQTSRPAALVRRALAARSAAGLRPRHAGRALAALRRHGVTVELRTPTRVVARIGAGRPEVRPVLAALGAAVLVAIVVAARRRR